MEIFLVIGLLVLVLFLLGSAGENSGQRPGIFDPPQRRAGKKGEKKAFEIIHSVLKEGDRLLTNVPVSYEDKRTELDAVVVNSCGVFILEVKNYSGVLSGGEEDWEWTKIHTTDAGNSYTKMVRNPIRQVKRQVYILANHIRTYSTVKVWVQGYALLLNQRSPVNSDCILSSPQEMDRVIHTPQRTTLSSGDVEEIVKLLS